MMIRCIAMLFCLILLLCGCDGTMPSATTPSVSTILIDPGHGGFDGGAVAEDGTVEKHLNLSIALCLRDLFLINGISAAMTRNTDCALDEAGENSIHSRKVSDMQARLTLYQQANTVISIHQNKFEIPKYAGTQLFYSPIHPFGGATAPSAGK